MYCATEPSLVTRAAFLAATETPFLRKTTTACSMSPLASVRACLQSIIGAPVFSRSSFTCAAEIFTVDVLIAMNFLTVLWKRSLLRFGWETLQATSLQVFRFYKTRPAPDDPRGSESLRG